MVRYGTVFSVFLVLTLVMTFPFAARMETGVAGYLADPLLHSYILSWEYQKLKTGMSGYYDANICFPHKNTLLLIPQFPGNQLFFFPLMELTGNAIESRNIILLLSFVLSGFTMFVLARWLLADDAAAFMAGLIFAFSPFRFPMMIHTEIVEVQWLPLLFLFLLKFFRDGKLLSLGGFLFFLFLQGTFCEEHFMFLLIIVPAAMLYLAVKTERLKDRRFLLRLLGGFIITVLFFFLLFLLPYYVHHRALGLTRPLLDVLQFSSDFSTYFSASARNTLYGGLLRNSFIEGRLDEGEYFLGFTILLLALFGLLKGRNTAGITGDEGPRWKELLLPPESYLFLVNLALLVSIYRYLSLFACHAQAQVSPTLEVAFAVRWLASLIVILLYLRVFLCARLRAGILRYFSSLPLYQGLFLFLALLAFSAAFYHFSFLLFSIVPGFKSLRVFSRFNIFGIFSLSILGAYGFKELCQRFQGRWKKTLVFLAAVVMILLESHTALTFNEVKNKSVFLSPAECIASSKSLPPVYEFLRDEKGDFAVLEAPSANPYYDAVYMYNSTFHWKKLFNGYTTYAPEELMLYQNDMERFPSREMLAYFQKTGIRYIVLHTSLYPPEKRVGITIKMRTFGQFIREKKHFADGVYLYEFIK